MNRNISWKGPLAAIAALMISSTSWSGVNVNNGNFHIAYTDFLVPTSGLTLEVTRTYNSRSNYLKGAFGVGWSTDYDSFLTFKGAEISYHEGGGGNLAVFVKKGKIWENGVFGYQTIEVTGKNDYVLHSTSGRDLHFNSKGQLTRISDRNKNFIELTYKDGLYVQLKDNFNNQLKIEWKEFGGNPHVVLLEMGEKKARYQYSQEGDLVKASGMDGIPFEYAYDDQHNMTRIVYKNGSSKEMAYDKQRDWITRFKDSDNMVNNYEYYADKLDPENKFGTTLVRYQEGSKDREVAKFWYEFRRRADGSRYNYRAVTWMRSLVTETLFTECCGTPQVISQWEASDLKEDDRSLKWTIASAQKKSTFFEYHSDGLLKKKTTPDGLVTELTYDQKFKKVASILRNGRKLEYHYDPRGNLAWAYDNQDNRRVDLTYDLKGRITVVRDRQKGPKAPDRFVYFRYNAAGKPVEIKEKAGSFSGTMKVSYNSSGEVNAILNGKGRAIASERDMESVRRVATTFQNLLEIVQPAGVSLTPEG